jgi:hypothetical protein
MDYAQQIDDLKAADDICLRHVITTPVNGVHSSYPRWPSAFAECERVHRWFLEVETMKNDGDQADRDAVLLEASRLPR